MKKFLLKCTALVLALAAVLYAGGAAYYSTNKWKEKEDNDGVDKYHAMPERITLAVFGPSHGEHAFYSTDWGEDFFNFALAAQTPQYDLMQMREFSDRIAPGATVVLTLTCFSPFWNEDEATFEGKQERYYRILSPENIVDCDVKRWYLGRFSPLLTTDVRQIISVLRAKPAAETPGTVFRDGTVTPEMLEPGRERLKEEYRKFFGPTISDVNPVQMQAYEQMLSLCRENGWNPVLVTVPCLQVFNDFTPDGLYELARDKIQEFADAQGVTWLDYSHDADFADRFDYYMDIDHLNYTGAAAFAAKLQPVLREMGLWE